MPIARCDRSNLGRRGFDPVDINAEAFVQARELFAMFDQLMHLAQNRRIRMLREISSAAEFALRLRHVVAQ
jgi:hypothetical protein